ncbi:MAG: 50S ribosomal protein L29 [Bacteroidota bacterium]|nr:50S ribosomal protein L29 [Bacteroidota bacterium]
MKQEVIVELSQEELLERLEEAKKQLVKMKLNHAVSPLENPNQLVSFRKTIARLKTEVRSRELKEKNNNK